jgi:hypothetical protein
MIDSKDDLPVALSLIDADSADLGPKPPLENNV